MNPMHERIRRAAGRTEGQHLYKEGERTLTPSSSVQVEGQCLGGAQERGRFRR